MNTASSSTKNHTGNMTKRSFGVVVAAILLMIASMHWAYTSIVMIVSRWPGDPSSYGFTAALSVFGMFTAMGLFQLKSWTRVSALCFAGLGFLWGGFTALMILVFGMTEHTVMDGMISLVYALSCAWGFYLFNRPSVKAQFKDKTAVPGTKGTRNKPTCPFGTRYR